MNVLITGSGSGFGKITALELLNRGHNVVATMRDIKGRNKAKAQELTNLGALVIELDVTNGKSIEQGIAKAINEFVKIDVVINNAGVGTSGLQEAFTSEDWQKVFDVNVFGPQRINRAILPHFRQNHEGLLLFVSSLLGRFVLPFMGPYNASKHALEAMAENYRYELSGLGIDCCVVEPGGYKTDFMKNILGPSDENCLESYGDYSKAPEDMLRGLEKTLSEQGAPIPLKVCQAIVDLIETPAGQRPFRTCIDQLGMQEPIEEINKVQSNSTQEIYKNFGMEDMLILNTQGKKRKAA